MSRTNREERAIIKDLGCSEELFLEARRLWLIENCLHGLLLGTKFHECHSETIAKYIEKAVHRENCTGGNQNDTR